MLVALNLNTRKTSSARFAHAVVTSVKTLIAHGSQPAMPWDIVILVKLRSSLSPGIETVLGTCRDKENKRLQHCPST